MWDNSSSTDQLEIDNLPCSIRVVEVFLELLSKFLSPILWSIWRKPSFRENHDSLGPWRMKGLGRLWPQRKTHPRNLVVLVRAHRTECGHKLKETGQQKKAMQNRPRYAPQFQITAWQDLEHRFFPQKTSHRQSFGPGLVIRKQNN